MISDGRRRRRVWPIYALWGGLLAFDLAALVAIAWGLAKLWEVLL